MESYFSHYSTDEDEFFDPELRSNASPMAAPICGSPPASPRHGSDVSQRSDTCKSPQRLATCVSPKALSPSRGEACLSPRGAEYSMQLKKQVRAYVNACVHMRG